MFTLFRITSNSLRRLRRRKKSRQMSIARGSTKSKDNTPRAIPIIGSHHNIVRFEFHSLFVDVSADICIPGLNIIVLGSAILPLMTSGKDT